MKFRFCGEADCPDWLLMQINTLSKLKPPQLEELCSLVAQPLIGKEMDYSKLREFSKAASLERSETKACVSAVRQVLESSSCHGVSPQDLQRELEQLGLDRLHSQTIARVYGEEREEMTGRLKENMLRTGRLSELTCAREGQGLVLNFDHRDHSGAEAKRTVRMSVQQAQFLLRDLKEVRGRMEELQN